MQQHQQPQTHNQRPRSQFYLYQDARCCAHDAWEQVFLLHAQVPPEEGQDLQGLCLCAAAEEACWRPQQEGGHVTAGQGRLQGQGTGCGMRVCVCVRVLAHMLLKFYLHVHANLQLLLLCEREVRLQAR